MTEEEKIKAAIKLLGPESRDDVEKALEIIDWQRIDILDQHEQQSKPSKKELIKYLAAMRKAAGAYYKLPSSYKLWLWELGAGDVDFKKEQRLCEKLLKETPVRKKGSSGDEKRIIAQEALNLIRKYKRSETLTRKRPSGLEAQLLARSVRDTLWRYESRFLSRVL